MSEGLMEVIWPVLSILGLLCLSAFFSGSETALTAASKARMHALEKEGRKGAKMVNKLRQRKDRLIGSLLLGNNLVNILASAIATAFFLKTVGENGVMVATLVMTLAVLIFAEVLPKTYALNNSDKMAMAIAPVIQLLVWVFAPVTEMISHIVSALLRRLGVNANDEAFDSTEEELRGAIDLHSAQTQEHGGEVQSSEQRAMLRSILDLAEVEVEDIMTHRKNVVTADANQPIEDLVAAVLDSPYTRMPIWSEESDNIIGVVHAKTLFRAVQGMGGDLSKLDLKSVTTDPWFIPETTNLFDQLQAFRERREHFAIVIDEYGSFMGIVTLEDILEEIVGEIDDEVDVVTVQGVRPQGDGSFLVDGDVTIRDLNRAYDWSLPDEEYATLAGLLLYESKTIPDAGQAFNFYGFRFRVVKRQRNQITLIRITPPEEEG